MSAQHAFQSAPAPAEQPHSRRYRTYTIAQLLSVEFLNMNRRTFFRLRRNGKMPFLQELKPRLGFIVRFRADLVDRYLAGEWNQPRAFRSHVRQSVAPRSLASRP